MFCVVKFSWSGVTHENILMAMSKKHGASTRAVVRFRRGYEREVGPVESQGSVLSHIESSIILNCCSKHAGDRTLTVHLRTCQFAVLNFHGL